MSLEASGTASPDTSKVVKVLIFDPKVPYFTGRNVVVPSVETAEKAVQILETRITDQRVLQAHINKLRSGMDVFCRKFGILILNSAAGNSDFSINSSVPVAPDENYSE